MEALKRYWPFLTALVAVSIAWGETRYQVHDLSSQMQLQGQIAEKQAEMREAQARIDERTKHIQEGQQRIERTLERLLQQRGR